MKILTTPTLETSAIIPSYYQLWTSASYERAQKSEPVSGPNELQEPICLNNYTRFECSLYKVFLTRYDCSFDNIFLACFACRFDKTFLARFECSFVNIFTRFECSFVNIFTRFECSFKPLQAVEQAVQNVLKDLVPEVGKP